MGILLAFAILFAGSAADSLSPAVTVEVVPVVEHPAINRAAAPSDPASGTVVAQAAGWIEPDPFPVYATALTGGTVEEVLFLEGDAVTEGQVLARLVDDDARLALRRAQAEAVAAEEAWEANIEAQRAASVATAGVREIAASLELARAERDMEMALLQEADRIHERRKSLLADGTISREEFDTTEASHSAQSARVRVVERRIDELGAKLDRAKAEEKAAQRRLELRTEERRRLDLARVALDEAQLRVDRLEIKAPIDGVVMQRQVEPGSVIMTAPEDAQMSRAAELYDPAKLQVRVDVPLADAAKIGVGQPARVVVEVLPDRTFSGKVSRITNRADIQKNTLEVKVALADPAAELKPEMLARVRFLSVSESLGQGQAPGGRSVFAPAEAIDGDRVWIVTEFDGEEGIAAERHVTTTGAQKEGWHEIKTGLRPGDLVIVSAARNLEADLRVRTRQGGTD
ncbi:efflux RND transporter periplasmic adaptor subunit [bacterium]|nr:efflux RND transporter periplasmic adaptor subunit [bacterium]